MNNPAPKNEVRSKKLDDLFTDDPYLSPTMKARQLFDRARLQPVSETLELADEGYEANRPIRRIDTTPHHHDNDMAKGNNLPYADNVINDEILDNNFLRLVDASRYLQGRGKIENITPAVLKKIRNFREETLLQWIKNAPQREID